MISYQSSDEVLEDLGDKVIDAFSRSVAHAAEDLAEYRAWHPDWVADQGERGLANWIHDRFWSHLCRFLDSLPNAATHESGVTREITVDTKYRLRAKRHAEDGRVSTYPTPTALEFFVQGPIQEALEGLEEVRLLVGYDWDPETRDMGPAVLSLRDGQDNLKWKVTLPESGAAASGVSWPSQPAPAAPSIEFQHESDEEADTAEGDPA